MSPKFEPGTWVLYTGTFSDWVKGEVGVITQTPQKHSNIEVMFVIPRDKELGSQRMREIIDLGEKYIGHIFGVFPDNIKPLPEPPAEVVVEITTSYLLR